MALQTAFDMVFLLPDYEHELHVIFWVLCCKNMSGVTILQQHREYPSREQLSGYSDDKTCVSCCKTQHLKVPHHRNFHLKHTSHHCFIHVWTKTQDFPNRRSEVERERRRTLKCYHRRLDQNKTGHWTWPGQAGGRGSKKMFISCDCALTNDAALWSYQKSICFNF